MLLQEADAKAGLIELLDSEPWVRDAPNIAVFCGNHRRQGRLHDLSAHRFANDHLDAFFDATVDATIAPAALVTAAEAIGLGCCPISAVRNKTTAVSDLLGLHNHVFPVAGLAFGYPVAANPTVSLRLPLSATVHEDKYQEQEIDPVLIAYDVRRQALQPYERQRACERFGLAVRVGRRQKLAIRHPGTHGFWCVHRQQGVPPGVMQSAGK